MASIINLNNIQANAWAFRQAGHRKENVFPHGSWEHLAYERGWSGDFLQFSAEMDAAAPSACAVEQECA